MSAMEEKQHPIQQPETPFDESSLEASEPVKNSPAETIFPEGGARAWSVALSASFVLFSTFGYVNAFGVFQEYYQTHQLRNKSPSTISWIGSLQVFFLFAGGSIGGPMFDRYGERVVWPPVVTFIFSVFMTSLCKEYYQFLLAQGLLGGISIGMIIAPAMASTMQYFNKKRGAAMGMAVAGSSLGGVIWPIAISRMFAHPNLGFGWTIRICGFIMMVLLGFTCVALKARLPPRKSKFFLPAAFLDARFDVLAIGGFLMLMGLFTPLFYLPTFAVGHGMSTRLAFYLPSILNGCSFFGRVIPGILADRVGPLNMMFAACTCTGVFILCWLKTSTNASILVFTGLYGFFSGALVSLLPVSLVRLCKDPRDIGTYMGMGYFAVSFGALAGPPINGAFVTHYGSFQQAAIFSGVVTLAGSLTIPLVKHLSGKRLLDKA